MIFHLHWFSVEISSFQRQIRHFRNLGIFSAWGVVFWPNFPSRFSSLRLYPINMYRKCLYVSEIPYKLNIYLKTIWLRQAFWYYSKVFHWYFVEFALRKTFFIFFQTLKTHLFHNSQSNYFLLLFNNVKLLFCRDIQTRLDLHVLQRLFMGQNRICVFHT